ncbi:MAG: nitric oxide synthase oxygenase, partial [Chloroflexota bacterium]|nr:nitric oxide synthase oxygenase [Chloroflexota bacterium]
SAGGTIEKKLFKREDTRPMKELHSYVPAREEQCLSRARDGLPTHQQIRYPLADPQEMMGEARTYLQRVQHECDTPSASQERLTEVQAAIERTGTYIQTAAELVYGARVAWRNSTRCIGRLHWKSLIVRDLRHLATAQALFEAIVEHLLMGTNGGKIRPVMSVFAPQLPEQPGIRIWNPQVIGYAGSRQSDGSVVGDPAQVELTEIIRQLGWAGGEGTAFDLLPLVIQMPGQVPRLFELPREAILEVPISHPDYAWFADLSLKWHALPVIANMRLEIGGISYSAAPFNGWYMGTEIGARNFGDESRYNLLPVIAKRMGLDVHSKRTLWKDRAMVELNIAVLHSFARHGVTMVDHHTASQQFARHESLEQKAGRTLPADWSWIVPPLSSSTTPVFHCSYQDVTFTPNLFYQPMPWHTDSQASLEKQALYGASAM